jgi:hypothetical protein
MGIALPEKPASQQAAQGAGMTTKPDHLPPMLCESELRVMENDLAAENFLQFAERMELNSAKQAVAASLDRMREISA